MTLQLSNTTSVRTHADKFSLARWATLAVLLMTSVSLLANTYAVNRVFTSDGSSPLSSSGIIVTLIGTVEIPAGNYTLDRNSPNPFTAVDLVMFVNDGGRIDIYYLMEAYAFITGNAKVIIHATDKSLTFDHTGNAGSADEAVLQFWDATTPDCFAIGHDSVANSLGCLWDGEFVIQAIKFPATFGVNLQSSKPKAEGLTQ